MQIRTQMKALIEEMLNGQIMLNEAITEFEKLYIQKALQINNEHLSNTANNLNAVGNGVGSNGNAPEGNGKLPSELPVFSIQKIQPARPFASLPISNDEALLNAIE